MGGILLATRLVRLVSILHELVLVSAARKVVSQVFLADRGRRLRVTGHS